MRSFVHVSDRLSRFTRRLLPALLVVAGMAAGPVAANSAPVDTSTILGKVMVG
jgi:hypothetical protein